jgi:hypothetical protein
MTDRLIGQRQRRVSSETATYSTGAAPPEKDSSLLGMLLALNCIRAAPRCQSACHMNVGVPAGVCWDCDLVSPRADGVPIRYGGVERLPDSFHRFVGKRVDGNGRLIGLHQSNRRSPDRGNDRFVQCVAVGSA